MKIKVTEKDYEAVCRMADRKHRKPVKQSVLLRKLIYFLAKGEMKAVDFTYDEIGMERLGKDEPCLYLMNHSSFTDILMIGTLLADRQYHIVCTNDAFVGKARLMERVGCISTKKFITDPTLVKDMKYTFDKLRSSIVMYPEASYSFDGSMTPLPKSLAKCLKLMKVPVVMIKTDGAFIRDPLYNNLQKRKAKVKATITYLLSPEEIATKKVDELYQILSEAFTYDHFRSQYEQNITVNEPFRADGLHRVLYKCPSCHTEGQMLGKGTTLCCKSCSKEYRLEENGTLKALSGETEHTFVTDWYAWERGQVRREVENAMYRMEIPVDIRLLVDEKSIYSVGDGTLVHTKDGFELNGCDGRLHYTQSGNASYSLYADYFWYEIGDMICIGDHKTQYYCFPKNQEGAIVAKARLATEEIFRMHEL